MSNTAGTTGVFIDPKSLGNTKTSIIEDLIQVKETLTNIAYKTLKDSTPVDTGRARDSWIKDSGEGLDSDYINSSYAYIQYLNSGTVNMQPAGMTFKATRAVKRAV